MLDKNDIATGVANCLVKAGSTFRKDQLQAYGAAINKEKNPNAKWVLERLLENAKIAAKKKLPLCDDTGIPHVFVEIGNQAILPPRLVLGCSRWHP